MVVRSTLESVYEKSCLHGGLGDYVVGTLLGGHFVCKGLYEFCLRRSMMEGWIECRRSRGVVVQGL